MLIKKLKEAFSKVSLIVFYAFDVFIIIYLILAVMALAGYLLTTLGVLDEEFYLSPLLGVGVALFVSFIISLFTTILSDRILLRPIREMTEAMNELANGNFDIHMRMGRGFRPRELVDFGESFNETAKELRSVKILRSDFINNFSHEFKTPVVSLRGFAELLKDEELSAEERQEYLDIIITESTRLSTLATNVLNLSKIENQAILTDLVIFNLSEQIRHAVLMMESKWSAKGLVPDVNLDEVSFYGNEELLSHIWVNLLDNAIKFSDQGGRLRLELIELSDGIEFRIRDYGCGMDPETQAHIFEKFYQAEAARDRGGNGLGMTIVKKVVTLSRGEIVVDSHPGQGTLITVSLPKLAQNVNKAVTI
jgi:signal transduction histidine kinase